MSVLLRRIVRRLVAIGGGNWYNPFLSVIINWYYLPLWQAVRFPIACYGWPRLLSLGGKIRVDVPSVRFGMIKLNMTCHYPYHSGGALEYVNDGGTLVFKGPMEIASGCRILLYGEGILTLGRNVRISSCCQIGCSKRIDIGNTVNMAANVIVYDTDFHFVYDIQRLQVRNNAKAVSIGNGVWIGTRSYLSKGAVVPDGCIVSHSSVVTAALKEAKPYSVIRGNPAVVVATDYTRIRGEWEERLYEHFKQSDDPARVNYEIGQW